MNRYKEIIFMIPQPISGEWITETKSMLRSMGIDTHTWRVGNSQAGSFFVSDTWAFDELKDLVEPLDDILLFQTYEDYQLALKEWTL